MKTQMLNIRAAERGDTALILELIRGLAEYEKLSHEVVATPELLEKWLFGERPVAEVLIAEWEGLPRGFALFFHNFSTFLGRPGLVSISTPALFPARSTRFYRPTEDGRLFDCATIAPFAGGLLHHRGVSRAFAKQLQPDAALGAWLISAVRSELRVVLAYDSATVWTLCSHGLR